MIQTGEGDRQSYESDPSILFHGVRFVLLGFEPEEESKVRSKLINGGGVDVCEYRPSCTHVIVDKVVFDDPRCVAARNEGKSVVNSIWVDHCCDAGTPVDEKLILYRPVKDLNGIPGARSFIICLTGYQRQDRDDIMRMVGLMGAQFSKPLVAKKVTHLICYKFEGLKYDLAKTMKIKLVNHRWLENCLRAWEVLPESDYDKSGQEIEMMEAEAKDSEDEMEKCTDTKQIGHGSVPEGSSSKQQIANSTLISKGISLTVPAGVRSENPQHASTVEGLLYTTHDVAQEDIRILNNTGKDIGSAKSPDTFDVTKRGRSEFGCEGSGTYCEDRGAYDKTPSSLTGKRPINSDAATLDNLNYSRKMPKKSPVSMVSVEHACHSRSSLQGNLEEYKFKDDVANGQLKFNETKDYAEFDQIKDQMNISELHQAEAEGSMLPQKRKLALSDTCSGAAKQAKSDLPTTGTTIGGAKPEREVTNTTKKKLSHDLSNDSHLKDALDNPSATPKAKVVSNAGVGSSKKDNLDPRTSPTGSILASAISKENVNIVSDIKHGPTLSNSSPQADAVVNSGGNRSAKSTKSKSSSKKSLKCGLPVSRTMFSDNIKSLQEIKVPDLEKETTPEPPVGELKDVAAATDSGDVGTSTATDFDGKAMVPESRTPEVDNSGSTVNLNIRRGKSAVSLASGTKKALANRSLGSRSKLVKGGRNACKDSQNMDQTITPDEATFHFEEIKSGAKKILTKQPDMVGPNLEVHEDIQQKTIGLPRFGNMDGAVDDETEAPKKDDSGMMFTERMVVPSPKADMHTGKKSQGLQYSPGEIKKGNTGVDEEADVSHKDRLVRKKTGKSTSKANRVVEMVEEVQASGAKEVEISVKDKRGDLDDRDSGEKVVMEKTKEVVDPENKLKKKTDSVEKTENPLGIQEKEAAKSVVPSVPSVKYFRKKVVSKPSRKSTHTSKTVCETGPVSGGNKQAPETGETSVSAAKEVNISHEKKAIDLESNKKAKMVDEKRKVNSASKIKDKIAENQVEAVVKGNKSRKKGCSDVNADSHAKENVAPKSNITTPIQTKIIPRTNSDRTQEAEVLNYVKPQPVWFILSGHRLQRKEFQQVIRRLKGRFCRDSHNWSYQATHFIVPDPVRRTEKFFAAAASGRWILKTDYLSASNQAGKFLEEEPYEWFKSGLSEDGAISLEAPRKWRLLREKTGHGAFYGMRIIIYGECIAPPLDTLKRVVKAGDGTILATSPPYTKFLKSGVDFAIISPGMPRVDLWVQEFLRNEIPCVMSDYLVEYVCKPGYSLERHVLYNTHAWAEKSLANLLSKSTEIIEPTTPSDCSDCTDISCQVCGSRERGEVMLICGDESGSVGCGIGTHIDCCDPPLEAVPNEDWFCPKCSKSENSSNPSNPTKKKKKKESRSKGTK